MTDLSSLAHPYANAVFALAKSQSDINGWLSNLSDLALAAQNKDFTKLINNPSISASDVVVTLVSFVATPNKLLNNFLVTLQENNRLALLSAIYELFERMAEDEQNTAKAVIQSAYPMADTDRIEIEQLLAKKFGRKIVASVEVHTGLIGGIKILINDTVIDASVKGSLNKMAAQVIQ